MATLIGGITTSHVPAIGRAIARNLQGDEYFKPFFDGFPPIRRECLVGRGDLAPPGNLGQYRVSHFSDRARV